MTARSKHGGMLRATLCEVERGLFYATYSTYAFGAELLELPTYELGTCASQVKQQLEKSLQAFGYEAIIWEDAIVLPQSHLPAVFPQLHLAARSIDQSACK